MILHWRIRTGSDWWFSKILPTGSDSISSDSDWTRTRQIHNPHISAMEPHCLRHAVPRSLDICSTQRSSVHQVLLHGASNRDTELYPPQHLISSFNNNNIRATQWADYQWNAKWMDNPTRLRIFIPDTGTHTPGMTLPRKAWVRLKRLRTGVGRFRSCLYKWGTASSAACECSAETKPSTMFSSNVLSNPSTSPWTAWPDGSEQWDNRMAAQHLPRDLVRPSSGLNNWLKRRRRHWQWFRFTATVTLS